MWFWDQAIQPVPNIVREHSIISSILTILIPIMLGFSICKNANGNLSIVLFNVSIEKIKVKERIVLAMLR